MAGGMFSGLFGVRLALQRLFDGVQVCLLPLATGEWSGYPAPVFIVVLKPIMPE
jgi:hypothetical protein